MPWKKGQSGNPGGRSPIIKEVQALAREEGPGALRTLVSIHKNPKASPAARISAAIAVLDRGYGKPMQDITTRTADVDPDSLTDAELIERITEGERQIAIKTKIN